MFVSMSALRAMKANIFQGLLRVALNISRCLVYTGEALVCPVLLCAAISGSADIAIRAIAAPVMS